MHERSDTSSREEQRKKKFQKPTYLYGGLFLSRKETTIIPMTAIILIGIPGSGKSTFCQQRFFFTHVRISLDMPHRAPHVRPLPRPPLGEGIL